MATFEAQVEGLTSLSIDGSSAPTQAELTQFLTDGAAEVINAMPAPLKFLCATEDTFTSTAVGSEAETLESSSVLSVTRSDGTIDQPCREIPAVLRGKASDSDDMIAATATDPVYYIYNGKINALPASGSCKYLEVNNPTVAYSDSSISNFPDEYEYLVPLYASVKSLQNVLSSRSSNADITTALTAINTELDETQAVCDLLSDQVDAAVVQLGESATQVDASVDTALTALKNAADRISTAIGVANLDFDKSDALLDLGEADSEGDINTALTAINAEIDECLTIADNMHTEIALINDHVDLAKNEADEITAFTDGSATINTALTAMNTAADKFREDNADPSLLGDESVYTTGTGLTSVKTHVDRAISYINGDFPNANYDLAANLADVDSELTSEDTELASGRLQQVQATINAVDADLRIARAYIEEWNTLSDTLTKEVNAFASEVNARVSFTGAKSQAVQAYINTANGYASTARGYGDEIQAKLSIAQAYSNEVNTRLAQARTKREESQARINLGNAYLAEARADAEEASAYATEVNARMAQVSGYGQVVSGYISAANGYANEITNKISIAQGYANEVGTRLSVDNAQYAFYEKQQAKLQLDYDKGIQILRGG